MTIKEKRIKYGIERMAKLGFIDETDKHDRPVKQFKKYDDEGFITDTINFYYNRRTGLTVFTNDIKNGCGSSLNRDLLYEIELMSYELEAYFKEKEQEL